MYQKTYVIITNLGQYLKEGMVCRVYEETETEFRVEILNPPENMFPITYAVNKALSKHFYAILPI